MKKTILTEEASSAENDAAHEKGIVSAPARKVAFAADTKDLTDSVEKSSGDAVDRDAALALLETEKRLALIKAWEESEKSKAETKAYRKLVATGSWESSKRASVEAEIKKMEEEIEKKKAEQAEKMRNKIVEIHKAAEAKKVAVAAKRREDLVKVEETAAKFRTTGYVPRKLLRCFSS